MDKTYPNIRRKRKPLLPPEPAPTICPHCGRSSAEPVTVSPPPPEKPKPDDADNASSTAAP